MIFWDLHPVLALFIIKNLNDLLYVPQYILKLVTLKTHVEMTNFLLGNHQIFGGAHNFETYRFGKLWRLQANQLVVKCFPLTKKIGKGLSPTHMLAVQNSFSNGRCPTHKRTFWRTHINPIGWFWSWALFDISPWKKNVTMHPFVVLSLRSFFSLGIRVPETFFKLGLHVDLSKPRPGNLPSSARAWKNGTYGWSLFFHPKWRSPKTHVRYPKITCYFSDLFQLQKLNRYKNPLHFKTPLRKCSTLSPHVCVLCFAHPI